MTTVYGSWVPNSTTNQRMRLRLEYTVPSVAAGQTSVTVTGSVYVEARYSFNDSNNTFSWSGSLLGSGSSAKSINVATNGSQQIHTFSKSVTLTNSAQGLTVAFSLTGIDYVGSSLVASVSTTVTIPARVYLSPNAPSSANVTRVSDSRHDLAWAASPTSDRPIDSFEIQKWRLSTGTYAPQASVSGSSRSYIDNGNHPNDQIEWRIRSVNSAGVSAWVYFPVVWTTPAAATDVTATRLGTDVDLDWTVKARDASSQSVQSRYSTDGGSTWTSWADVSGHTGLPKNTTSRTITGLDTTVLWQFRIATYVTTPTQLVSYSSASATLQLLTPPNPPTLLSPTGTVDRALSQTLKWKHNPVDTTAQTAAEVRHRPAGGAWTTVSVTTAQQLTVAADTWPSGNVEWQVRTKGQHADFGAWSATGIFTAAEPPAVSITSPAASAVIDTNKLKITIAYNDPQGAAMTSWRAELLSGGQIIETKTGKSSVTSVTFATTLEDLTAYSATFSATAGTGLTSSTATWSGSTDFIEPAPSRLQATWNEPNGTVQLAIENLTTSSPFLSMTPNPSFEAASGTVEVWRNRVPNPSFETGTGNVAAATQLTISTTAYTPMVENGSQALVVEVGAGAGTSTYIMQSIAGVAGETIGFRCALRLSAGPCYARLSILYYDDANANIATESGAVFPIAYSNTMYELTATAPAPAGTTSARVAIYLYGDENGTTGPASGTRISTDSWVAVAGGVLPPAYFDGETTFDPDLTPAWVGTGHASESQLIGTGLANVAGPYSGQIVRWQATDRPYDGSYVSRQRVTSTAGVGIQISNFAPVNGTTYTMLMRVRPNRTQDAYPRIGGNTGPLQTFYGGEWNEVRLTIAAMSSGAQDTGLLLNSGQHRLGDIWDIDTVAIVEGTYNGAYDDTVPYALVNGAADTVSNRIERSDDDGLTWQTIADGLPLAAGIGDDTAPLNDTLMYRNVSVSALGTEAISAVRIVETPSYRVWLNTSDGDTLMLAYDIQVTGSDGHEVVLEDYFGYTKPIAHFGEEEPTTVQVTARVARGYGIEQNRKKFLRKPVFYRDPFGRAFWATLTPGGIQMAQSSTSLGVISFTVEEIAND